MTQREVGDVLGVDQRTAGRDLEANASPTDEESPGEAEGPEPVEAPASHPDEEPLDVLSDETLSLVEDEDDRLAQLRSRRCAGDVERRGVPPRPSSAHANRPIGVEPHPPASHPVPLPHRARRRS